MLFCPLYATPHRQVNMLTPDLLYLPAAAPGREGIPMLEPDQSCTGRSKQQPFTGAEVWVPLFCPARSSHRPHRNESPWRAAPFLQAWLKQAIVFQSYVRENGKKHSHISNEHTRLNTTSDPPKSERGETEKWWKAKPLRWPAQSPESSFSQGTGEAWGMQHRIIE